MASVSVHAVQALSNYKGRRIVGIKGYIIQKLMEFVEDETSLEEKKRTLHRLSWRPRVLMKLWNLCRSRDEQVSLEEVEKNMLLDRLDCVCGIYFKDAHFSTIVLKMTNRDAQDRKLYFHAYYFDGKARTVRSLIVRQLEQWMKFWGKCCDPPFEVEVSWPLVDDKGRKKPAGPQQRDSHSCCPMAIKNLFRIAYYDNWMDWDPTNFAEHRLQLQWFLANLEDALMDLKNRTDIRDAPAPGEDVKMEEPAAVESEKESDVDVQIMEASTASSEHMFIDSYRVNPHNLIEEKITLEHLITALDLIEFYCIKVFAAEQKLGRNASNDDRLQNLLDSHAVVTYLNPDFIEWWTRLDLQARKDSFQAGVVLLQRSLVPERLQQNHPMWVLSQLILIKMIRIADLDNNKGQRISNVFAPELQFDVSDEDFSQLMWTHVVSWHLVMPCRCYEELLACDEGKRLTNHKQLDRARAPLVNVIAILVDMLKEEEMTVVIKGHFVNNAPESLSVELVLFALIFICACHCSSRTCLEYH